MFQAIFSLIIRSILNVITASGFIHEAVITVKMFLIMSENNALNMYSSQETINYPTQLHLVGHFYKKTVELISVRCLKCGL
jgi:hypothetical protein